MTTTDTPVRTGFIRLKNVRLSFSSLWKPEAYKPGDEPKFKASFLIPKDHPQVKAIEAKILAVLSETKGVGSAKAPKALASIRGNANKFCFGDGDTRDWDGYEGNWYISAKSKKRPPVYERDGVTPTTEADGLVYDGCYVNADIAFFSYDSGGIGVSAGLEGVQFKRDGDAFTAGRTTAAGSFEAEAEDGADADEFA